MSDKRDDINREDFELYLKGQLSPREAYELERKLLERKFEYEAMEGLESVGAEAFTEDMEVLESRLEARISPPKSIKWYQNTYYQVAAATILVVVVGYFIVNSITQPIFDSNLALEEKAAVPADTLESTPDTTMIALNQPEIIEEPTEAKPEEELAEEILVDPSTLNSDLIEGELEEAPELLASRGLGPEDSVITEEAEFADEILAEADLEEQADPLEGFFKVDQDSVEAEPEKEEVAATTQRRSEDRSGVSRAKMSAPVMAEQEFQVGTKMVSGKIFGEGENDPLPGVNVLVKGSTTGVITDIDGNYSLEAGEDDVLVFSYIGFSTAEVRVGEREIIDFTLNPDVAELSEVVVTGYGVSSGKKDVVELGARPTEGYGNFRRYVDENLQYPQEAIDNNIEGRVVVLFTINSDGSLGNFRIKKGLGFGCDDEAIRLIKEGPEWQPTLRGDETLTEEMRVTIRFKR